MPEIKERAFEEAIVNVLVSSRPDSALGNCRHLPWLAVLFKLKRQLLIASVASKEC